MLIQRKLYPVATYWNLRLSWRTGNARSISMYDGDKSDQDHSEMGVYLLFTVMFVPILNAYLA